MNVHEKYNQLRDVVLSFVQHDIDSNALIQLKNNYANEIDSKRKMNSIKDIPRLIQILETRDVLNWTNIEPYYYIAKRIVDDPSLMSTLTEYENWLQTTQLPHLCNMYMNDCATSPMHPNTMIQTFDQINTGHSPPRNSSRATTEQQHSATRIPQTTSRSDNHVNVQIYNETQNEGFSVENKDSRIRQTVIRHISERLGRSWRDVARFLSVREYQIDEIQNKHPFNLKEQSYEALYLGLSQYNSDKWKIHLMRALEKSRRKDLKELVEQIILDNNCSL